MVVNKGKNSGVAGRRPVVTIDGPSGVGKSTVSRLLAQQLGATYLDTGAMYRAVGLVAERQGIDPEDAATLEQCLAGIELEMLPAAGPADDVGVRLNGEDISAAIRTPEAALAASWISAYPPVRRRLTELQRQLAAAGGVVAEGRDMGTVVLPAAEHKFYLDASAEERTRRRCQQLRQRGEQCVEQEILAQIKRRDHDDSQRVLAPLKPAADAVIIDCSRLDAAAVVAYMLASIEENGGSAVGGMVGMELEDKRG